MEHGHDKFSCAECETDAIWAWLKRRTRSIREAGFAPEFTEGYLAALEDVGDLLVRRAQNRERAAQR